MAAVSIVAGVRSGVRVNKGCVAAGDRQRQTVGGNGGDGRGGGRGVGVVHQARHETRHAWYDGGGGGRRGPRGGGPGAAAWRHLVRVRVRG